MSDPYRPQYYESSYAPENPYNAGPYPGNNSHSQPNSQNQLSRFSPQPSLSPYYPPGSTYADSRATSSHHHHSHRSRSRNHRSRSRNHRSRSRNRSRSRSSSRDRDSSRPHTSSKKSIGAAAVGAGVGGFLGHEIGGGALGTVGGILAGAIGAQALEKKRERHKSHRRATSQSPPSRPYHRRSGSSNIITTGEDKISAAVTDVKDKISGFLSPHGGGGRSRSHVDRERRRWDGSGGSGRRGEWSSEEEDGGRSAGGGGRRRY